VKWLKRSALTLLAVVVLALAGVGAVLYAVGTDAGTAWLVRRLLVDAPVSVARIRGSLLDGVVLEDIRFRTARDELDIDSLMLQWDAAAFLTGTLAFERADVQRATYRRVPGVVASGGGPPELPWPVQLDAASVATLSVTIGAQTVLLDDTTFAASYGGARLVLEAVETSVGPAAIGAEADFDLRGGIDADIAGRWSMPVAGVPSNGSVTLTGTWPELRVHHELEAPFAAATDGNATLGSPLRAELVTEWVDLAWPGVDGLASPTGRLAVEGTLDSYRYDGSGTVEALGRSATFTVAGTAARFALELARLVLTPATLESPRRGAAPNDGGTLAATGNVQLQERAADLQLTATTLDPAWLVAAWPGRLTGTARLSANLVPETNTTLDAISLAGSLRGYPVSIGGAVALTGRDAVTLDGLRLDSQANYVVLNGTLDRASLDLAVEAELAEVALLVPDVHGALSADVAVGGTWLEPRGRGRVGARNVSLAGVAVERLDIGGEAGLAPDNRLALTVEAAGIVRGPVRVGNVRTVVDGTTAAHTARIEAGTEDLQATVAASGGVDAAGWRGTIEHIGVEEPRLGPWRLDAPAALSFGRGFVTLANSCLLHTSQARWCTQLDMRGRREDSLVVSGQNFDLATIRPLLPPALELGGVYQLSGSLLDLIGEPRGAIALNSNNTRARIAFGDSQAFDAELDRVQAGMTLTDGRLELTAAVRSTSGGRAEVLAAVADVRERDSPIDGTLHVEWPDLAVLTLLSPQLGEVGGALAVDLTAGGTVAEPTVDGRAVVSNGRVVVPQWGLVVERIEATAASADGRELDIDATGYAGDGVLTLEGSTQLDPDTGWPTRLALRGDAVRVVQRPDAEIVATPDLRVEVALPAIDITGSVHVPHATLTVDALPAQAVTPSPDAVVHGGDERDTRARPLEVRSSVELTLGDDVRYSGLNLDTTVGGELRLATQPNASANATGTLRLAGTYDAYGQRLDIERGQLLFSGPLDNPGLDVRAVRRIETTEVGIELTGTLRSPRTRIVSTPAMNEADALSYLLFGRPASGSNAGLGTEETSALQTAALSLGLQQALPVVQRIGNTLGLDELTVQSTTTDAGELMAGKYLSPKVYIRYSYGLFNRIGGLLLRFKVNERLSIETRSGENKSMDLLYTVEKE
jgi:translocation and assembly module TamB